MKNKKYSNSAHFTAPHPMYQLHKKTDSKGLLPRDLAGQVLQMFLFSIMYIIFCVILPKHSQDL